MLVTLVAVGYPASPRFVAPPLAGICVLAGVGVVGLWRAAPAVRLGRPLAAVGLAVLLGTLVLPRVGSTAAVAESARVRADVQEDLRSAVRRVGRERLLRCGTPVLRHNMEWNGRARVGARPAAGEPPTRRVRTVTFERCPVSKDRAGLHGLPRG